MDDFFEENGVFFRGFKLMDILLTFTGFNDPYSLGLVGDEEVPGPILSLTESRQFDRVILFSTLNTEKQTSGTRAALEKLQPSLVVDIYDLSLPDPTDYHRILRSLRSHLKKIVESATGTRFFISVASGTPQMHACWLLLAASGEIPARILQVRPRKFVTTTTPLVSEIDFTSQDFPVVRAKAPLLENVAEGHPEASVVVQQLGIVGDHDKTRKALEIAEALAPSSAPVLILGETGTGKELFAKFVHLLSGRPAERFVPVNCAALPKELVESILFGHKKGSFTGAVADQTGKFDHANGGTLFLDELGELPLPIQAKLLRVLQDSQIEPIGAKQPHKVDVRIIAATNVDVHKTIREGQFRPDLYYRLNVGEIRLPPLRERRTDIPKIALHVLDRINAGLKKPKRLSPEALSRLQGHAWAGNVRDLENCLERSARLAKQDVLQADDLLISEPIAYADPLAGLPEPSEGFSIEVFLASARKQLMLKAVDIADGNQSEAARLLGISPQAVHKFLQSAQANLQPGLKRISTSVKDSRHTKMKRKTRKSK
ncbi:RNA repair transcriptional activator RtcR family protein [Nitrospira sp. Nam80]